MTLASPLAHYLIMKDSRIPRRQFIGTSTAAGAGLLGLGELPFLNRLSSLSAQDVSLPAGAVTFRPEIEPLVRLIESSPREQVLEQVAARIKSGTSYQEVLSALLLAGVRNIQPRPVGFKFHAVLVVNSAHLASIASADNERWLPIFWALDYFKSSQARDVKEGDWTMQAVDSARLPSADKAKQAFHEAMQNWDVEATDVATAAIARSYGAAEILDLFARYGCRDYRDIGHKAIYVANAWRTLQVIGWQHAEPVLRSLAYALLAHGGSNPAERDDPVDRPGRQNETRLTAFRTGWESGRTDPAASLDLAAACREGTPEDASQKVLELINQGIDPQSIWDAVFNFSGELLRRQPGIVSLHTATTSNAMHFAYQTCGDEATRKRLLLQNAAFLPLFRGKALSPDALNFDQMQTAPIPDQPEEAITDIFKAIDTDKSRAVSQTLEYLNAGHSPNTFIDTSRRYLFLKGNNSHDYKFSSAVLEDYYHISPAMRDQYLAASIYNLRGSEGKTNGLVDRIHAALEA